MLKKLVLSLVMASSLSTLVLANYNNTPKKEALLVGVSHFKGREPLYGIEQDIQNMKKLLESRGFRVTILYDSDATYKNVVNKLKSYQNLAKDDRLAIYFSTHGTQVPDLNGDEKSNSFMDKKDEAYVLYDANSNIDSEKGLLIDDELENLLSAIPAKKILLSDSCHSGTMYKSFNVKAQVKSIQASKDFHYKDTGAVIGPIKHPKDLVVLGATQDNEQSIATEDGSLFTEAVYDVWTSNPGITFVDMKRKVTMHITIRCQESLRVKPFTPSLYATNERYLNEPIDSYLEVNLNINFNQKSLIEDYLDSLMSQKRVEKLDIRAKSEYEYGEKITLNIDTLGKKGYLYIITTKETNQEIDVLYPNPYVKKKKVQVEGTFVFPQKGAQFVLKADNTTGTLERTVIYAILSEQPIEQLELSTQIGYNHFQSILKDYENQVKLKNSFKDIIIRKKNNKLSIGKIIFNVKAPNA